MKKIGYAVLGLNIGMAHVEGVLKSENAELVAVCDIDKTKFDDVLELSKSTKTYDNFEDLIKDEKVDIISICLPSGMHAEYAIRAMRAGKNVLIEKPLEVTSKKCKEIIKVQEETGKKCGVVFQNRYNLDMKPIFDAVKNGKIGKLFFGDFAVKWYRDQHYYDNGNWRGTWEMDGGGSLINQSIHTLDLMMQIFGKPKSVYSTMNIYNHNIKTEDFTTSIIKFENGATATFTSSTVAFPGISTDIMIYGENGSIEADGDRIKTWKFKSQDEDELYDEKGEEEMLSLYGKGNKFASQKLGGIKYGHDFVVEDIINAVIENRDPLVTPIEAIKSIELIEAIYKSAKTNKTIIIK